MSYINLAKSTLNEICIAYYQKKNAPANSEAQARFIDIYQQKLDLLVELSSEQEMSFKVLYSIALCLDETDEAWQNALNVLQPIPPRPICLSDKLKNRWIEFQKKYQLFPTYLNLLRLIDRIVALGYVEEALLLTQYGIYQVDLPIEKVIVLFEAGQIGLSYGQVQTGVFLIRTALQIEPNLRSQARQMVDTAICTQTVQGEDLLSLLQLRLSHVDDIALWSSHLVDQLIPQQKVEFCLKLAQAIEFKLDQKEQAFYFYEQGLISDFSSPQQDELLDGLARIAFDEVLKHEDAMTMADFEGSMMDMENDFTDQQEQGIAYFFHPQNPFLSRYSFFLIQGKLWERWVDLLSKLIEIQDHAGIKARLWADITWVYFKQKKDIQAIYWALENAFSLDSEFTLLLIAFIKKALEKAPQHELLDLLFSLELQDCDVLSTRKTLLKKQAEIRLQINEVVFAYLALMEAWELGNQKAHQLLDQSSKRDTDEGLSEIDIEIDHMIMALIHHDQHALEIEDHIILLFKDKHEDEAMIMLFGYLYFQKSEACVRILEQALTYQPDRWELTKALLFHLKKQQKWEAWISILISSPQHQWPKRDRRDLLEEGIVQSKIHYPKAVSALLKQRAEYLDDLSKQESQKQKRNTETIDVELDSIEFLEDDSSDITEEKTNPHILLNVLDQYRWKAWGEYLDMHPEDRYALEQYDALSRQLGHWEVLAQRYEKALKGTLVGKVHLYELLAEIYDEILNQPMDAIRCWSELLMIKSDHLRATRRFFALVTHEEEWTRALDIWLQLSVDEQNEKEYRESGIRIFLGRRQLDLAIQQWQKLSKINQSSANLFTPSLLALAQELKDEKTLIALAKSDLSFVSAEIQIQRLLLLARIYAGYSQHRDEMLAIKYYKQIYLKDHHQQECIYQLVSLFIELGKKASLLEMLELAIHDLDGQAGLAHLIQEIAIALELRFDDIDEAFHTWLLLLDQSENQRHLALYHMMRLAKQKPQHIKNVLLVLEECLQQSTHPIEKNHFLKYKYALHEKLKHLPECYQSLLALQKQEGITPFLINKLEGIMIPLAAWEKWIEVQNDLILKQEDAFVCVQLLEGLAQLYEMRLERPEDAKSKYEFAKKHLIDTAYEQLFDVDIDRLSWQISLPKLPKRLKKTIV